MKFETNKIYHGNTLDVLKTFPNESISMCITSPPYWALRDYGTDGVVWDGDPNCEHEFENGFCIHCGAWKGQLGLEPDFNLYIKHLCDIFDEVKRVLRKDGTLWVNLGDTYHTKSVDKSLPLKSLCNIPARFSIEMQNRGWIL